MYLSFNDLSKGGYFIRKILFLLLLPILVLMFVGMDDKFDQYKKYPFMKDKILEQINHYNNGVEYNGQLSTNASKLVNQNNEVIQLRGMSSHGLLWYPEYTNYASIKTTRDFGANVFRIAMYSYKYDGYVDNPELSKQLMYMAVENTIEADMYVVVDWHVLKDNNPNTNVRYAVEFFEEISKRYPDNPSIIYEICNEPNGDVDWKDIKKYADKVIPKIRENSPNALIIVGTPKFSTGIDSVVNDPLDYSNILYAYHFYSGISGDGYVKTIENAIENDIAIFVSEWGMKRDKSSKKYDYQESEKFIDFLNKRDISWINWSLSNKEEDYSSIKHTENKLSHWTYEDLTENGKFVFKLLKTASE